tara:strand:+ start:1513 stop:1944 length:432 start_codon:yes stop_codon:yes gene_type:complete
MNVSTPRLPALIKQSLNDIVDDLYESDLAERCPDLSIDVIGVLNYTLGAKLRLSYVDGVRDEDMDAWRHISYRHGAVRVRSRVITGTATVELNIEYKGADGGGSPNKTLWIFRAMMTAVAMSSYYQLHLLDQLRYPFPSVLSV